MNLGWIGAMQRRSMWKRRKDEQCVYFTCAHICDYTFICRHTSCMCGLCLCVHVDIYTNTMHRVHRAHTNKHTPDVLILRSVRKRERNEMAFEYIDHIIRYTAFWRTYNVFCAYLFWVRGDSGATKLLLQNFGYHVKKGCSSFHMVPVGRKEPEA